mgnify:CR=1 FL=1
MSEPVDSGVKSFKVGGQLRELKFSAAMRYRLFLNINNEDIQQYISSEAFKITAVGFLLYGKEISGKPLIEVLDKFDEDNLLDDEMEEIVGWVRQRTLNFMLKEAEQIATALQQAIPKATELSNTLSGLQNSTSTKYSV